MNAHGVVVAMPLGQSWTPTPSIGRVVNVGTVRCRPRLVQPARERAGALSAVGAGRGGGLVVVAGVTTRHGGRESRPQGEGGQQVGSEDVEGQEIAGEYRRAGVRSVRAERRVLEIQTKLHRWARDDPHRRFDDLFNLVADPGFLLVAWDRVRGNKGARTAGVDGQTAYYVEAEVGVEVFLDGLRSELKDRSFRPLPARERMIPKPGTTKRRRLGISTVAGPGGPGILETGVGADLRGGFSPVFLRVPPEAPGS